MYFEATCEDPTPANGQVNPAGLTTGRHVEGATVNFTCNSGYRLNGADSATCQVDGSWSVNPPTCTQGTLTIL